MPEWYDGDLLLFSGRGWLSRMIRLGTCSAYSHIGIVCTTPHRLIAVAGTAGQASRGTQDDGQSQSDARSGSHSDAPWNMQPQIPHPFAEWQTRPLLYESTTLTDLPCAVLRRTVRGVQAHDVADRLDHYDGRVWRLRLSLDYQLGEAQRDRLALWLLPRLGRPYDRRQAVFAGFRSSRCFPCLGWQDDGEEYCAELVVGALKILGLWPIDESASVFPPGIVARRLQKSGVYHDLVQVK